jgi:hypothetical protein
MLYNLGMDVFIVEKGSVRGGGSSVAVFPHFELAEICADGIMKDGTAEVRRVFGSHPHPMGYGVWKKVETPPKYWKWQDATDYVIIKQMPILNIVIPA